MLHFKKFYKMKLIAGLIPLFAASDREFIKCYECFHQLFENGMEVGSADCINPDEKLNRTILTDLQFFSQAPRFRKNCDSRRIQAQARAKYGI
jgi:hypothetical protein